MTSFFILPLYNYTASGLDETCAIFFVEIKNIQLMFFFYFFFTVNHFALTSHENSQLAESANWKARFLFSSKQNKLKTEIFLFSFASVVKHKINVTFN